MSDYYLENHLHRLTRYIKANDGTIEFEEHNGEKMLLIYPGNCHRNYLRILLYYKHTNRGNEIFLYFLHQHTITTRNKKINDLLNE